MWSPSVPCSARACRVLARDGTSCSCCAWGCVDPRQWRLRPGFPYQVSGNASVAPDSAPQGHGAGMLGLSPGVCREWVRSVWCLRAAALLSLCGDREEVSWVVVLRRPSCRCCSEGTRGRASPIPASSHQAGRVGEVLCAGGAGRAWQVRQGQVCPAHWPRFRWGGCLPSRCGEPSWRAGRRMSPREQ